MEERRIDTSTLEFQALKHGDGGKSALLFHGFPDDAGSMKPLMRLLADNGYTAIAPYMRGYRDTHRPPLKPENYSIPKIASDVIALADSLDMDNPVLIGHDWGSIAVTTVARLNPSLPNACVSISVPPNFMEAFEEYPSQALRSWYMGLFQLPGFSEELLRRDNYALIERLWRMWSPGWDIPEERLSEVKETFNRGRTVEAALQYYRSFYENVLTSPAGSMQIRGIETPTLLVAGKQDGCITSSMYENSGKCFSGPYEIESVNGAGHFVHIEKPRVVAEKILDFA